jgi:Recombination endonuclease VII
MLDIIQDARVRKCNGACGQIKSLSEYHKETGTEGLKKTICKVCLAKNKKGTAIARKILGPAPPIGYRCICGFKEYLGGPRGRSWSPDHDHNLNRTRSWLCLNCNTGLGKVKDNPNILLEQVKYLLQYDVICDKSELRANIITIWSLLNEENGIELLQESRHFR